MSILWPSSLPQRQFLGLRYAPQPQVVRTETDTGPGKARRRFTAGVKQLDLPVRFRGDQLRTFLDWYDTTLAAGALRFTWRNPATGAQVEMRFRAEPEWSPEVAHHTAAGQSWTSNFALEILP
jgi:hypothetical protein